MPEQVVPDAFYDADPEASSWSIFDTIDRLLCDDRFGVVDKILDQADATRMDSFSMRALLVITNAAKAALPCRQEFWNKAYAQTVKLRGPDDADRLLNRLL